MLKIRSSLRIQISFTSTPFKYLCPELDLNISQGTLFAPWHRWPLSDVSLVDNVKSNVKRFNLNQGFYDLLIIEAATGSVLYKKGVPKNFDYVTGKHLCQSLFFKKAAGLRPEACNIIKKEAQVRLWHRCFPVYLSKFWRTAFLQKTSRRLSL